MTPDIIGEALVQAFAERGYQAVLDSPGSLTVQLPDGSGGPLDISEWRGFAGRNSRADLPENAAAFVRGFLRKVEERAAEAARSAGAAGPAWNEEPAAKAARGRERVNEHSEIERMVAEGTLRVRIYAEEELNAVPGMREALVTRPLAPGLLQTVVVDHPDSIMPLNRGSLGGGSENSVFGAALRSSIEKEPHYTKADEIWDVPFMHIGETHRYIGSHVHVLKRYAGQVPYGALVSFPIPEYIVVHEIGNTHLFAAMEAMQALTRTHFEKGEKAISPQVFWWRPGTYERLPEQDALNSGQVPDLRPVGIEVDHEQKSVAALTAEADELIQLWTRDHT